MLQRVNEGTKMYNLTESSFDWPPAIIDLDGLWSYTIYMN